MTHEKHDQQSVKLKLSRSLVISKTNQLTGVLKSSINFVSRSHWMVVL